MICKILNAGTLTGKAFLQKEIYNLDVTAIAWIDILQTKCYYHIMILRYRYLIHPTEARKRSLAQFFGYVRAVRNDALEFCEFMYRMGKKKTKETELQKEFIGSAKKEREREWLSSVSAVPLQQSINNLEEAYRAFFKSCTGKRKGKKVNPPRRKKRKSKQSARFTRNGFSIKKKKVYLDKIGLLKTIWSRPLPSEPSSVTVIKDSAGRYFLSFVVKVDPPPYPDNRESVGIDLGISTFATLSTGEKIDAPKPSKKHFKRLRRAQKVLSRKAKQSKRRERARKRVAKIHAKIKDTRTDFLHKVSTKIIRDNQTIVLEDLNVSGMIQNRKLSREISDLDWRSFRTTLSAKSVMYGRDFQVISRWEQTSQRCSCCGEIGGKKALNVREWTCLFCGTSHDCGVNAAINTKVAAGHSETQNGRGGKVRLSAKKAQTSESSTHPKVQQSNLFNLPGIIAL